MNPLTYLKQAQKQYPQLRLAWGLVGIAAAAAMISALLSGRSGLAVVVILVLAIAGMFVLSSLARTTKQSPFRPAAVFLVWVCTAAFAAALVLVLTAAAFDAPRPLADRLFPRTGPVPTDGAERAVIVQLERLLQQLTSKMITRAGLGRDLEVYATDPADWRWQSIGQRIPELSSHVDELQTLLRQENLSRFAVEQNQLYRDLLTLLEAKRAIAVQLASLGPAPHTPQQRAQIAALATQLMATLDANDTAQQKLLAYLGTSATP